MLSILLSLSYSLLKCQLANANHIRSAKGTTSRDTSCTMNQDPVGSVGFKRLLNELVSLIEILDDLLAPVILDLVNNEIFDAFLFKLWP